MTVNYGSKRLVVGAHYGFRDWLSQRVTALLMAVYTLLLLAQVSTGMLSSNEDSFVEGPLNHLVGGALDTNTLAAANKRGGADNKHGGDDARKHWRRVAQGFRAITVRARAAAPSHTRRGEVRSKRCRPCLPARRE